MQKQKLFGAVALLLAGSMFVAATGGSVSAQGGTPAATMAGTMSASMSTMSATMAGTMQAIPGTGKITGGVDGEAKALTGAGSTFTNILYTKWFSEYEKLTGVKVNYQSIGSGGGIKGIQDQTLDFGASDGSMTDDQIKAAKGGEVLHIATTLGGVAPTYNIPELAGKDPLKFTPEDLVAIYKGSTLDSSGKEVGLVTWNDPRLVADNPSLADVKANIIVVHRSDGSGTTNIFTSYLTAVDPTGWGKPESAKGAGDGGPGAANAIKWPTGIGAKGSDGVAGIVKQTPYSIGYVELAYATQNKLPVPFIKNKAGKWVQATNDSVSAAGAGFKLPDDMRIKIVNADGDASYPITGFTWMLIYAKQTDPAKALAITRLAWWGVHDGQQYNVALNYSQLPLAAIQKDETLIEKITINGKQALPAGIASN